MRLATWNVNSLRARIDRVADLLVRESIDVALLQEIKCKPEQVPLAALEAAGYQVAAHGLNQWNGVAVVSRIGLDGVETSFPGQPRFGKPGTEPVLEARAIGATCGPLRVWSVYVPNGRGLADPHYAYKRTFLTSLADAAAGWAGSPTVIGGDFNVAPLPTDIWDESDPDATTHVTADVRADLERLDAAGYVELSRRHVPQERAYTFWDYQQLRFPKGEGMRIDFLYASQAAAAATTSAVILRDERKGTGASDHVPVVADLSTSAL